MLALLVGCTTPARPADAPVVAPEPSTVVAPQPPPNPEPAVDEMPERCCIVEVRVAESGYALRLYEDGHATEAWPSVPEATVRPFDPGLHHDVGQARFAERQGAAWGPLLAEHDGAEIGPLVAEGTPIPGGSRARVETITLRGRVDGVVRTVTIRGDLRVGSSLGPFEGAWKDLGAALKGPRH